jgi:hypothetical protein
MAQVIGSLALCLHVTEIYEILTQLQNETNIFIFNALK